MDDITLKSVLFGGFRKKDVIAYIEQLKRAEMEQMQIAADKTLESAQATKRIAELEQKLEESRCSNEELALANASYTQKVSELEQSNAQMQVKMQEMEANSEKLHAVESQIGGMMLEAQIYSDKLIDEAKGKVASLSEDYCQSAKEISTNLVSYTRDLSSASSALTETFSSYIKRILDVSKNLETTVSTIQREAASVSSPASYVPAVSSSEPEAASKPPVQPLHVFPSSSGEGRPQITDSASQKPFSVDVSRIENTALYQSQAVLSNDFYADASGSRFSGSLSGRGGFTLNS